MNKPDWWPKNPYPESVFTMKEEQYADIVVDSNLRTALSGMLGRLFWNMASEAIWQAILQANEELKLFFTCKDCEYSEKCNWNCVTEDYTCFERRKKIL